MKAVLRFWPAVLLVAGFSAVDAAAQGWGMRRIDVTLTRKLPSAITFTGSTVKVRIETKTEGRVPREVAEIFRSRLTAEVFKDTRIVETTASPDAIIEATINEFSASTSAVRRPNLDLRTGRNTPLNNRVVQGQVTVSYRTLDGRTKKGLDAGNLRFAVEQEFIQTGEPYRELFQKKKEPFKRLPQNDELYQYLVDGIVMEVTKRVVSVDEKITVPLPKGKLEDASKLGAASRWGAMLEAAERMSEFPKASDESFRQYSIGVANEALAYQETSRSRGQDLLAKAALAYKKAIQANPDEDVFLTAQNRMATYVGPTSPVATSGGAEPAATRGVTRLAPEVKTPPAKEAAPPPGNGSRSAPDKPGVLTNEDVLKFVHEKFTDQFLLETINGAASVDFDLSTDSLIELKRAGVSERVIRGMRTKMATAGQTRRTPKSK
jgi:hypothetical protein